MDENGVSYRVMKKILASLFCIIFATNAVAAENPFFGKYENQIAFHFGQGIDSGFLVPPPARPVPFYMFHFQYSQPTTFFRVPARQSLNIGQTLGLGKKYDWDWKDYTIEVHALKIRLELGSIHNSNGISQRRCRIIQW